MLNLDLGAISTAIYIVVFCIQSYVTILGIPCFYVFLINKYGIAVKKTIRAMLYAIGCITFNGVFLCYDTILIFYFNIGERGNRIDIFPLFIVVPITIIVIGTGIMVLIKKIKNRKKRKELNS